MRRLEYGGPQAIQPVPYSDGAGGLGRIGGDRAKEALTYYAKHAELPEIRLSARNVLDEFSKEPPIVPKPPAPPEEEKQ